jgi:hypothetical protein
VSNSRSAARSRVGGRGRPGGAGPAQHRPDAGDDLLKAERLGDVVVAADGQAGDLVLGGVLGRQEQHRGAGVALAEPSGHVEAVQVGQHHVQDHQVGSVALHGLEGLQPAGGGGHLEPGQAQAGREQLEDVGLVLHHQQPGLRLRLAHTSHSPLSGAIHIAIVAGDPWRRLGPSWEVAGSIICFDVDTA